MCGSCVPSKPGSGSRSCFGSMFFDTATVRRRLAKAASSHLGYALVNNDGVSFTARDVAVPRYDDIYGVKAYKKGGSMFSASSITGSGIRPPP